jgi:hypothetical protein
MIPKAFNYHSSPIVARWPRSGKVVDGHDARTVETGGVAGLGGNRVGPHSRRLSEGVGTDLDGDVAVQVGVVGQIDRAESAGARGRRRRQSGAASQHLGIDDRDGHAAEVADIERQELRNAVALHRGHESCVVRSEANYAVSFDQAQPKIA